MPVTIECSVASNGGISQPLNEAEPSLKKEGLAGHATPATDERYDDDDDTSRCTSLTNKRFEISSDPAN
jgi:hypothetical protein